MGRSLKANSNGRIGVSGDVFCSPESATRTPPTLRWSEYSEIVSGRRYSWPIEDEHVMLSVPRVQVEHCSVLGRLV